MYDLAKEVCRIIGHTWEFPGCVRCGTRQIIAVHLNGILQQININYVEDSRGTIVFTNPTTEGDHIAVTVGMQGNAWGRNDFIADGGRKYTVYSYI